VARVSFIPFHGFPSFWEKRERKTEKVKKEKEKERRWLGNVL
jgi:hypothetical protein